MRTDITKESLQAAIEELGDCKRIAERFGFKPNSLYPWLKKYGLVIPRKPMNGDNGERRVCNWLQTRGFKPALADYYSPFDILCNNKRVEVKRASYTQGFWLFNIHRHGKLDESQVDVYILRLENVPEFKNAIHLIMPAPIGVMSVKISMRSLLTRYAQHYNRFDLLSS